eukprot:scaffold7857_cov75-Phaeocystis_antarctica.AAC.3
MGRTDMSHIPRHSENSTARLRHTSTSTRRLPTRIRSERKWGISLPAFTLSRARPSCRRRSPSCRTSRALSTGQHVRRVGLALAILGPVGPVGLLVLAHVGAHQLVPVTPPRPINPYDIEDTPAFKWTMFRLTVCLQADSSMRRATREGTRWRQHQSCRLLLQPLPAKLRFVASVADARRLSMASRSLAPTTAPFYHLPTT